MTLTRRGRLVVAVLSILALAVLAWAAVHAGTDCYREVLRGAR